MAKKRGWKQKVRLDKYWNKEHCFIIRGNNGKGKIFYSNKKRKKKSKSSDRI